MNLTKQVGSMSSLGFNINQASQIFSLHQTPGQLSHSASKPIFKDLNRNGSNLSNIMKERSFSLPYLTEYGDEEGPSDRESIFLIEKS